jgi:hypothetical protein
VGESDLEALLLPLRPEHLPPVHGELPEHEPPERSEEVMAERVDVGEAIFPVPEVHEQVLDAVFHDALVLAQVQPVLVKRREIGLIYFLQVLVSTGENLLLPQALLIGLASMIATRRSRCPGRT